MRNLTPRLDALVRLVGFGLLLIAPARAFADEELRNDGFDSGDPVAFQGGFAAGEIAAVRLTAPTTADCPCSVEKITLLFGGSTASEAVTLRLWQDDGSGNSPGTSLFDADYQLTGSATAIHEIDLSGESIVFDDSFRVGIEFQHDGFPSVAADLDGTITAARNFIYVPAAGWFRSQTLGLTGDWILRATVRSLAIFKSDFETGTFVGWSEVAP